MRVYGKSPPAPRPAGIVRECVGCDQKAMPGYAVCRLCAEELGGLR